MRRQRMAQAGVAIGMLVVSILGLSSPASAVPTSFVAKAVHASGAGKLAVQATGGMTWYNRSVTLTSVRFYANAGECGYLAVHAWQGQKLIHESFHPAGAANYCGGTTGKWFTIGTIPLDGSAVSGGITEVHLDVFDVSHEGRGYAWCDRASFACATGQY